MQSWHTLISLIRNNWKQNLKNVQSNQSMAKPLFKTSPGFRCTLKFWVCLIVALVFGDRFMNARCMHLSCRLTNSVLHSENSDILSFCSLIQSKWVLFWDTRYYYMIICFCPISGRSNNGIVACNFKKIVWGQ